ILTAPPPPRTATLSLHAALPISARLACIRHAASVRPEPGSNSPGKFDMTQRNHGSFSLFSFQGTPSFLFRRLSRRRILSYHGLRRLSTTFFSQASAEFFPRLLRRRIQFLRRRQALIYHGLDSLSTRKCFPILRRPFSGGGGNGGKWTNLRE